MLTSLIDPNYLFTTFGAILIFAAGVVAFYLALFPSTVVPSSCGHLRCQCGQVVGKFSAPKNSPSAACHCADCIRFVDWTTNCKNCSLDMKSNHGGVQLVQLYKNQVRWTQGTDKIKRAKLSKCAPLDRLYATCCGTPIGFTSAGMKTFPLLILHREILTYENGITFDAIQWRMNTGNLAVEKRSWRREQEEAMESDGVPMSFMMTLLGRVMYGMYKQYNAPDPLENIDSAVEEVPQP